jgi:hypothetical protein
VRRGGQREAQIPLLLDIEVIRGSAHAVALGGAASP